MSDREKKVGLIMSTHICTYRENFVKIGPVLSEIIGLQETVKTDRLYIP